MPAKEAQLTLRPVVGGQARILVPKAFRLLDEQALSLKYPNADRPQEVYSDDRISINLALHHKPNALNQTQITPALADGLLASIKRAYPTAEVYGQGVKTINGRKVAYLEVLTPAVDTKVYIAVS